MARPRVADVPPAMARVGIGSGLDSTTKYWIVNCVPYILRVSQYVIVVGAWSVQESHPSLEASMLTVVDGRLGPESGAYRFSSEILEARRKNLVNLFANCRTRCYCILGKWWQYL
jgi:hypothetical protein